MAFESPLAILTDIFGVEIAVSSSQSLVPGLNHGLPMMGSGSNGAQFLRVTDSGFLFITGALDASITSDPNNPLVVEISGSTVTNDGALFVTGTVNTRPLCSNTSVVTGWNASTVNGTLFASNQTRNRIFIKKRGPGVAYVKLGAGATSDSFTNVLTANSFWEIPNKWCGQVDIAFDNNNANSNVVATELSE